MNPTQDPILYVALELSSRDFRVVSGVPGGRRRQKAVPCGNIEALTREVDAARKRAEVPKTTRIVCCYEAGSDKHWLS